MDIKLIKGGVDIPISLKLPGSFGGVTGSATLHVSSSAGLDLSSLRFQAGDVNLAALAGQLSAAFGSPVTITVTAQGFLYTVKLAQATLVYKVPDQATVTGSASLDLGLIKFDGQLGAIVNPTDKNNPFGGQIKSTITIRLPSPAPDITLPSFAFAFNKSGFGVYTPFPGYFGFFGTVAYQWGDPVPKVFYGDDVTGRCRDPAASRCARS